MVGRVFQINWLHIQFFPIDTHNNVIPLINGMLQVVCR